MWTTRPFSGVWRAPDSPISLRLESNVTIQPNQYGVLDVGAAMKRNCARRDLPNVFTGDQNVFQQITANRVHFLSDERCKSDIRPVAPNEALALLRALRPKHYNLEGSGPAVGFLSQDVPSEFVTTNADGIRAVDYISLFAHLWVVVDLLVQRSEDIDTPKT